MIGSKLLIDACVVIEVMNSNQIFLKKITAAGDSTISTTVLGELFTGVYRAANKEKQMKKLNDFLTTCAILNVDSKTYEHFGDVYAALLNKGKPIPTNDVWIAASAKQDGLTLITKDKHFAEIEGLDVEFW